MTNLSHNNLNFSFLSQNEKQKVKMRKLSETDFYTKPQESSINSHLAQIQHYQRLLQQLESAKPVTPAAFVADIKASPSHFLGIPFVLFSVFIP